MTYTVLKARVKQKLTTEADWLGIDLVLFEGEQAFVYNTAGVAINFKIGDGTKKFSQLPYFIAYYSGITNCKILSYIAKTTNITVAGTFRNMSDLNNVILLNNSGADINLAIGTTNGGSEIGAITLPNGVTQLGVKYFFTSAQTVYFTGLTGKNFSLFVLYLQLDEAPVIPPSGAGSNHPFMYGTLYPFYPMYAGHENTVWNFVTGYGKTGSGYETAMLMGTNGTDDIGDFLKGHKTGETIGGDYGASQITILKTNLPSLQDKIYGQQGNKPGFGGGRQGIWVTQDGSGNNAGDVPYNLQELGGSSTPIDIKPLAKIVLYFTGIPTTT